MTVTTTTKRRQSANAALLSRSTGKITPGHAGHDDEDADSRNDAGLMSPASPIAHAHAQQHRRSYSGGVSRVDSATNVSRKSGAAAAGTAAGIGPKRKSKVGIAHHGHHGHHHAVGGAHARGNKSSQNLVTLATLSDIVADANGVGAPKMERQRSGGSNHSGMAIMAPLKTTKQPAREVSKEDAEAGWVSAASSTANSPDDQAGKEYMQNARGAPPPRSKSRQSTGGPSSASPSSFQPLEFEAKRNRRKQHQQQNQAPPVVQHEFVVDGDSATALQPIRQLETIQGSRPPSTDSSMAGTPTQGSASAIAQSFKAIAEIVPVHDNDITPIMEKSEQAAFPESQIEQIPKNSDDPVPSLRGNTQRKSSSNTLRSVASQAARAPPSLQMRRQTAAPLQPRLDLALPRATLAATDESANFTAQGSIAPPIVTSPDAEFPNPAEKRHNRGHLRSQSSASTLVHGTASSSKASTSRPEIRSSTLKSSEAHNLVKRLRTVSGNDLQAQNANVGSSLGRRGLMRSASSASGVGLSSMFDGNSSGRQDSTGGVSNTLKRASGYFGSLTRLASLAGFTTSATSNLSTAVSPGGPRTGSSAAASGTEGTITSGGHRSVASPGVGGLGSILSSSPSQTLRNTLPSSAGSKRRGLGAKPPLISKFIDTTADQTQRKDIMRPLSRAESSAALVRDRQDGTSSRDGTMRSSSRASRKMLTQRDGPFFTGENDFGNMDGNEQKAGSYRSSVGSDEDGHHVPMRTPMSGSSTPLHGGPSPGPGVMPQFEHRMSGGLPLTRPNSTQLQPVIQRWLVGLAREAERIDRQHVTIKRFCDPVQLSFARILEKRSIEEEEEKRTRRREALKGSSASERDKNGSRPASLRGKSRS